MFIGFLGHLGISTKTRKKMRGNCPKGYQLGRKWKRKLRKTETKDYSHRTISQFEFKTPKTMGIRRDVEDVVVGIGVRGLGRQLNTKLTQNIEKLFWNFLGFKKQREL